MPPLLLPGPIATVPPPATIRQMLCIRTAEVALLRRLLRVSESRERMLPPALVASVTVTHPADPPEGVSGD
jgi:hypothetical protein